LFRQGKNCAKNLLPLVGERVGRCEALFFGIFAGESSIICGVCLFETEEFETGFLSFGTSTDELQVKQKKRK